MIEINILTSQKNILICIPSRRNILENTIGPEQSSEIKLVTESTNELLLVDDDQIVLFIHRVVLEELKPYSVSSFISAIAAIGHLFLPMQTGKKFLILLDINMPTMNGWEMLDILKIHPLAASISVVMVSSSSNLADIERCREWPMVIDYLTKPLTQEKLLSLLNKRPDLRVFFKLPA